MSITLHSPRGLADSFEERCKGDVLKGFEGIICVHSLPDFLDPDNPLDFQKWRAGLTPLEWDSYLQPLLVDGREQDYAHNLITNDGLTTLLKNMSFYTQEPFGQIMSIGNGAIAAVARADTAVAGDGVLTNARKAPASSTLTGNQADVAFSLAVGDIVGTWTNVGMYGWNYGGASNATTTAGTGSLKTHSLFSYIKGSYTYTVDYIFVINN